MFRKSSGLVALPFVVLALGACPNDAGSSAACRPDAALKGASYDIAKSRFAFGSKPVKQNEGLLERWVGSDGALAIFSDGSAGASLNGGAPEANLPGLNGDPTEHVRDYFIAMGVQACQIDAGDIHASGEAGGPVNGSGTVTKTFPVSVSLVRAIDGINVVESIAWAQFDVQDQTTAEGFYWPEIPADVVQAAVAFRDQLSDGSALAEYKAKLPADAQGDGNVVIHHTGENTSRTFAAVAVYDVVQTLPDGSIFGKAGSLYFDRDGQPVSNAW
jgi:hypothetical protein